MRNPQPGPSLAGRALLALLLLAGFYLLAAAIAGGLLLIPYAEWRYAHHLNPRILIICVVSAGAILWAIVPRIDRFTPPGPLLTPERQPRLFEQIRAIAAATGQAPPAEVYLVADVNAWVAQRGGLLGLGGRRVMGIGLALLQSLSVGQLRAVLAHEFGHYHGGDTRLGPIIHRTYTAIARTIEQLGSSSLQLPFRWYGTLFLRVTHAISRAQEYTADALAAQVAGPQAMIGGLHQLHRVGPAFESYWRSEVGPLLNNGHRPPIAAGFAAFIAAPEVARSLDRHYQQQLRDGQPDPLDTHPTLRERVAAVELLALAPQPDDGRPALELLDRVPELELELLQSLASPEWASGLRAVEWPAVGEAVYVPYWRALAVEQATLGAATVAELPELARRGAALLAQRSQQAEADQRRAQTLLGGALASALHGAGWSVSALPGDEVQLTRGGALVEPFSVVGQLMRGELAPEAWRADAERLGIGQLALAPAAA